MDYRLGYRFERGDSAGDYARHDQARCAAGRGQIHRAIGMPGQHGRVSLACRPQRQLFSTCQDAADISKNRNIIPLR